MFLFFYLALLLININGQIEQTVIVDKSAPRTPFLPKYNFLKSASTCEKSLQVPSYLWSYGCFPTCAAMIVGYYDRLGYKCLYQGPTNGGVPPFINGTTFPSVVADPNNHKNPISASGLFIDGRLTDGHIEDFYKVLGDTTDRHTYVNGVPPHDFSINPCTADYCGTSQWQFGHPDGGTRIQYSRGLNDDGNNLNDLAALETSTNRDGLWGLKLFFERANYFVIAESSKSEAKWSTIHSPFPPPNGSDIECGFKYEDYKAEIDAGRPVIIGLVNVDPTKGGHYVVGIGYNDCSTDELIVLDTWHDYATQMDWDGIYAQVYTIVGFSTFQPESLSPLKAASSCNVVYGPYDHVDLTATPERFAEGSRLNFTATFVQGEEIPLNYPQSFNFTLKLYYGTNEYTYASATLYPQAQYALSRTWSLDAATIPDYQWNYNEDGTINGTVEVSTTDQNGYVNRTEKIRLWVCKGNTLNNVIYSAVTDTIEGCKIKATNVTIKSNSNITFQSGDQGTILNGPFTVELGSAFYAK